MTHVLLSCLEFEDGTWSVQPLQYGDLETCQRVGEMIPAIANNTGKPHKQAFLAIRTKDDYEKLFADEELEADNEDSRE